MFVCLWVVLGTVTIEIEEQKEAFCCNMEKGATLSERCSERWTKDMKLVGRRIDDRETSSEIAGHREDPLRDLVRGRHFSLAAQGSLLGTQCCEVNEDE